MQENRITITSSIINDFEKLSSFVSEKFKICIITEGYPFDSKLLSQKSIKNSISVNLRESLFLISRLYDLKLLLNSDNKFIYNNVFIFLKNYTNPKDFPCVSYSECLFFLKKSCDTLALLGGRSNVTDSDNIIRVVGKMVTLLPGQFNIDIPINKLNSQQKKCLQECAFHLYIQEIYNKALYNYSILQKIHQYNILYDGSDYFIESIFGKKEKFLFLPSDKNINTSKIHETKFARIPESKVNLGQIFSEVKKYKCNLNEDMYHKPIGIFGKENISEDRLVRCICIAYGLNQRNILSQINIEPKSLGDAPNLENIFNFLQMNIPTPLQNSFDISIPLRNIRQKIREGRNSPTASYDSISENDSKETNLLKSEYERQQEHSKYIRAILSKYKKIKKSNILHIIVFVKNID